MRVETGGLDESLQRAAAKHPAVDSDAVGLYAGFSRLRDRLAVLEEDFLTVHGITPGRFAVLLYLTEEADAYLKPSDLATKSGVTRATITGLLDTLERDGLITRTADQFDRRVTLVAATEAGRSLIELLMPEYLKMISTVTGRLTGTEREVFQRICDGMEEGSLVAEQRFIQPPALEADGSRRRS